MQASTEVSLQREDAQTMLKLLDQLGGVQKVNANATLSADVLVRSE